MLTKLHDSAGLFDQVVGAAGDYPLATASDHPFALELSQLYSRLSEYGTYLPLNNRQLTQIAATEVRTFHGVVGSLTFHGSPLDWRTSRDAIDGVNRLMSIGLIVARISALNGHATPPI